MKALAAGLAMCLLSVAAPRLSSQGQLSLSGIVRDGVTSRPVASARVQLSMGESGVVAVVATKDDGTFSFENVKPGEYVLMASKPPYGPASIPSSDSVVQRPIRVVDRAITDLDFVLMPGAVIAGQVIDPFGQPAAGAAIDIRRAGPGGRRVMSSSIGLPIWADERGEYRLSGLVAGDYVISARANTWMDAKLGSSSGPDFQSATVYFPDAVDIAQAELVRVTAGQERSGVNVRLRSSVLHTVTGSEVKGPDMRDRYASIRLRQYRLDLAELSPHYFGAEQISSGFRVRAVPPGHYWLTAQVAATQQWNPDASAPRQAAMWAATEVIVSDADVSGVTLSYLPVSSVSGRVVGDAPGSPPAAPAGRVGLSLVPMPGTPPVFYETWASGLALSPKGEFTIASAVPGRHKIRVRADGLDLTVVSVTVGEVTTEGDVVDVAPGWMKGVVIRVR